jgi:hypothetical protein
MDPCGVKFTSDSKFARHERRSLLPCQQGSYWQTPSSTSSIMTLAGVAQSVERVALITAKRSTSRSWVRAPPSAIPISKLNRAAVLLLFGRLLSVCSLRVMSTVCSLFWLIRSGVRRQQIVTKPPKMHAIQMESQHAKPSSSLHSFVLDFTADLVHHHAYECHITTTAAPCLSRLQQAETSRR